MTQVDALTERSQKGFARDGRPLRCRTVGGWWLSTGLLLLLGGVFPLIFTEVGLGSLLEPPVLLSIVIIQWASTRLVSLLGKGEPRIVQATFWVFVYVWFGLAALAETVAQQFPIANQSFTYDTQIRALLTIMVGLAAYQVGLVARRPAAASSIAHWAVGRQVSSRKLLTIAAIGVAGTVFALWELGLGALFSSRYAAVTALYGEPGPGQRLDEIGGKAVGLLQATFVWAPAFLALYLLVTLKNTPRTVVPGRLDRFGSSATARVLLVVLAAANVVVNNPISSPRYRFGGVALALVAVGWPLHSPRRFRLWAGGLILAILFALPVLDIFRYDDRSFDFVPLKEQLVASPDFGMFQQELNAQLYVDTKGFTTGQQTVGVVFGYVPRALWEGKPIDTGNLIVRSSAINASASLWATAFIDGGVLAVGVALLAYGWLTRLFEELYVRRGRQSSFIASAVPLYAGFQIIILRGDLQPAVGQLAPLLIMLLYATHRSRPSISDAARGRSSR